MVITNASNFTLCGSMWAAAVNSSLSHAASSVCSADAVEDARAVFPCDAGYIESDGMDDDNPTDRFDRFEIAAVSSPELGRAWSLAARTLDGSVDNIDEAAGLYRTIGKLNYPERLRMIERIDRELGATEPIARKRASRLLIESMTLLEQEDKLACFIALLDAIMHEPDTDVAMSMVSLLSVWVRDLTDDQIVCLARFFIERPEGKPKNEKVKRSQLADIIAGSYTGQTSALLNLVEGYFNSKRRYERFKAIHILDAFVRHGRCSDEHALELTVRLILQAENPMMRNEEMRRIGHIISHLMLSMKTNEMVDKMMKEIDRLSNHENPLIREFALACIEVIIPEIQQRSRLISFFTASSRFGDPDAYTSIRGRNVARGLMASLSPVDRLAVTFMESFRKRFEA